MLPVRAGYAPLCSAAPEERSQPFFAEPPKVVRVNRSDINRTSASQIHLDGKKVILEGLTGRARHTHGGDAAKIATMTMRVYNPLPRALSYHVDGVEWLTDHNRALPAQLTAKPAVGSTTPAKPPGTSTLKVFFAVQQAYHAHCERFASRAKLRVEGKTVAVAVEHEVARMEPMSR